MALETKQVVTLFEEINRIPRCSRNEERIRAWLLEWAAGHGLDAETDAAGNVLIRVPASPGFEDAPTIVMQGHMDMVCEKTPDSAHNFETDPIPVVAEGDWLRAHETTLGADNGIAIALALAVAVGDAPHPALEILITSDEETGLTGAQNLAAGWLRGTHLLNLDSEDEGVFTVGCAGGRDTIITVPVDLEPVPGELVTRELAVSGLQGGHSGVDIHLGRANANRLLVRALAELRSRLADHGGVRLASLRGGNAHNAIPRDAAAVIAYPEAAGARVQEAVSQLLEVFRAEYGSLEPGVGITLRTGTRPSDLFAEASTTRLLDALIAMPHGVVRMSSEVPGLVETSTNFATVRTNNDSVVIKTSQRSSYRSRLAEIAGRIEALARLAGAQAKNESSYPPWEPRMESELLGRAVEAYRETFSTEPVVEVIHAGLECGVIGSKYPEMEMISLGPTIQNPHSPDERLNVPSLGKVCRLIEALLASYADA